MRWIAATVWGTALAEVFAKYRKPKALAVLRWLTEGMAGQLFAGFMTWRIYSNARVPEYGGRYALERTLTGRFGRTIEVVNLRRRWLLTYVGRRLEGSPLPWVYRRAEIATNALQFPPLWVYRRREQGLEPHFEVRIPAGSGGVVDLLELKAAVDALKLGGKRYVIKDGGLTISPDDL